MVSDVGTRFTTACDAKTVTASLPPALLLTGPTASGKTHVALELVQRLPCEIISVDSALVYRDMNIGTAKPDAATLAAVPHHLIDIIDPTETYSAARFRTDALALMTSITKRGNIPLLVGGTMMYFNILQQGLNDLPAANSAIRSDIDAMAKKFGWPALHAELMRLDPVTAMRLKSTDSQRIQRALEVCRLSGKPMSTLLAKQQRRTLPCRLLGVALVPTDRALLHRRIAQRFNEMLQQGLIDEVIALRRCYDLDLSLPAMRCVGYRQVWQYLDGMCDFTKMRDNGIAATRQLAKRQLTWLRRMTEFKQIDNSATFPLDKIVAYFRQVL